MKKIVYLSFIITAFLFSKTTLSQDTQVTGNSINTVNTAGLKNDLGQIIRGVNDLKSGNWQDVLSNFFQLSVSDLTGANRALNFKSSLFALKLKTNPNLNVDTEYVKHNFDRNFQFNIGLGLDTQYRFNGFSAGFTWAAINKRDTTLISFINTDVDQLWGIAYNKLNKLIIKYRRLTDPNNTGQNVEFNNADTLINQMMAAGKFNVDLLPGFDSIPQPFNFKDSVSAILKTGLQKVYEAYDSVKLNTLRKPLLTFSFNTAFNRQLRFDSIQFGGIFLQGLTRTAHQLELDIRANIVLQDTLVGNDKYRTVFNSSAGFNYALISNKKTNTSILELKPYIEYDRVFSGIMDSENTNKFLANADIRLRITKDLWLPLTFKYDIKKGNFLGVLNVSLNMNAFKPSK